MTLTPGSTVYHGLAQLNSNSTTMATTATTCPTLGATFSSGYTATAVASAPTSSLSRVARPRNSVAAAGCAAVKACGGAPGGAP